MVQGETFFVLDISHQGEKVPISLATVFCTGSLLWSVAPTDPGQPLLEARMINLETCKLFFSNTTLCHLCCGSVLAARRFAGALNTLRKREENGVLVFVQQLIRKEQTCAYGTQFGISETQLFFFTVVMKAL